MTALLISVLIMGLPQVSPAKDPVFQTTKEQMVKELTRKPVLYRSFGIEQKKRSIVVMEKKSTIVNVVNNTSTGTSQKPAFDSNEYTKKTIVVVDNQDVPGLKLKIEFDFNSSRVRPASYQLLKELGLALTESQLKAAQMIVGGHTDADGTDDYNLMLSTERAKAVKHHLVSQFDIPESRITIRGYGESMPLAPNTGSVNKQLNRRVEIQTVQ